ncbi:MAG TPA: caspase family protein [Saprospiraceae bacterium]|nr:caspase family protein [Saprospiraceae bacterium]
MNFSIPSKVFYILFLSIAFNAISYAKTYSVIVGINEYSDNQNLNYAVRDAILFHQTIKKQFDEEAINYLLLNENATAINVMSLIYTLALEMTVQDQFILYFSGHGNSLGLLFYNMTEDLYFVSYNDLKFFINLIESENKIIILDNCNSGGIVSEQYHYPNLYKSTHRSSSSKSIMMFLSARPYETSIESGKIGHGLFTFYLCKGMFGYADKNKDGKVTIEELYYYTRNHTYAASKLFNERGQCPILLGNFNRHLIVVDKTW